MSDRENQTSANAPAILLGGGGHALVVADSAFRAGVAIGGFADDDPGAWMGDLDRLGTIDEVLGDDSLSGLPVILAMGLCAARSRLALRVAGRAMATVVHPSAIVSPSAVIGGGVFIGPGAIVNAGASVGEHAIINSGAVVEHECEVGAGAHVCPRACLGGRSSVGERAMLGTGATVLPGVMMGAGSVAGAMSLVNRDVDAGETVVGVPARALQNTG